MASVFFSNLNTKLKEDSLADAPNIVIRQNETLSRKKGTFCCLEGQ